ncbi:MAG: hypothetical protein V1702_02395 [Candidatus Woesearchaeota archaeon]
MTNLTLAIPEELHEKMKKHSEIRWSEVVRKTITEKIEDLELMNKLTRRSKLTPKDVEELAHKINSEVFEELNKR